MRIKHYYWRFWHNVKFEFLAWLTVLRLIVTGKLEDYGQDDDNN